MQLQPNEPLSVHDAKLIPLDGLVRTHWTLAGAGLWPRSERAMSTVPRSTRCCPASRPPSPARRSGSRSSATLTPPTSRASQTGWKAPVASSRTSSVAAAYAA